MKPTSSSTAQALRVLLATGLATNGAAMLAQPAAWYHAVPGVIYTGPLNLHFVRDIGAAYLAAAAGLAWRALRGPSAGPAAQCGALFLGLHAAIHVGETLAGLCGWRQLLADAPGVVLPALLAAALAGPWRTPGAPSGSGAARQPDERIEPSRARPFDSPRAAP
jgi:hypothetical protein